MTAHPTRRTATLALAAIAAGCASKPPKPAALSGTITVSTQANPSASQRPSPLLLRVYELKSSATFSSADFMSLYQRDQAELAADLVARDEYLLAPGESKQFRKPLAPETRFIGVLAAYREFDRATWRSVVALTPAKDQQLLIQAGERAVQASVAK